MSEGSDSREKRVSCSVLVETPLPFRGFRGVWAPEAMNTK